MESNFHFNDFSVCMKKFAKVFFDTVYRKKNSTKDKELTNEKKNVGMVDIELVETDKKALNKNDNYLEKCHPICIKCKINNEIQNQFQNHMIKCHQGMFFHETRY